MPYLQQQQPQQQSPVAPSPVMNLSHPHPHPPALQQKNDPAAVITLLVKHLPDALPTDTLVRLFSHYGACDVRPCVAGRLKNCAFVDFQDEVQAARAQSQLNRLRFLGKILAVEQAKLKAALGKDDVKEGDNQPPPLPTYPPLPGQKLSTCKTTQDKLSAAPGHILEPIAPSLGVDYPFPPHLEYAYPPPDGNILTNIVNALIAVPRFYTQVLHLMNKMNLPAPFRPALPTPPLCPPLPDPAAPKPEDLSSDESELESSEEADDICGAAGRKDVGRHARQDAKKRKRLSKDTLGATPTSLIPKERAISKKKPPGLQINITLKGGVVKKQGELEKEEGMNDEVRRVNEDEADTFPKEEETVEPKLSATRGELIAGRMPPNEILVLPMFKNYTRGISTPVLYVKNLAKDVTVDDLYYVFGAFFSKSEVVRSQLGIKLMQEGRMRGQAFVTFPSTDFAEDALNTTHGFILKGKPMIIQFGRNPTVPKKNED